MSLTLFWQLYGLGAALIAALIVAVDYRSY